MLALGCLDDDTPEVAAGVVPPVDYYYAYDSYYVADITSANVYWADSWAVAPFTFSLDAQAQGQTVAGMAGREPGAVLRALARGESVCPGQVSVVTTTTTELCPNAAQTTMRTGASVIFTGCILEGGGRLDGMVTVQSTPTLSNGACDASTMVNVSYTATVTNLSYLAPGGTRIAIASQIDTGSYARPLGGAPTSLNVATTGRAQLYDAGGALVADHIVKGTRSFTFSRKAETSSYAVDGALTVQDASRGATFTATAMGLTRTAGCCRPTGGTLTVVDAAGAGTNTWTFGPACGALAVNGTAVDLPACL
jgi:hypothetical protein